MESTLQKLRVGITFSNLPNFLNGDNGDEKSAIIRTGNFKYELIGVVYQTQRDSVLSGYPNTEKRLK